MGRSPCCAQEGLNRGAWTALEDKILAAYVKAHGEGKWKNLPQRAGLRRSGKSCRLRWLNYLRPDIKRGNISHDEEELIIRLHNLLGNRWSLIAGRLPGRTDNEIKNYWNTTLGKKVNSRSSSSPAEQRAQSKSPQKKTIIEPKQGEPPSPAQAAAAASSHVIRTKATRCTKVLVPALPSSNEDHCVNPTAIDPLEPQAPQTQLAIYPPDKDNLEAHHGAEEPHEIYAPDSDFFSSSCNAFQASLENDNVDNNFNNSMCMGPPQSPHYDEAIFEDWTSCCLDNRVNWDPDPLAFLLESEEWPCPREEEIF